MVLRFLTAILLVGLQACSGIPLQVAPNIADFSVAVGQVANAETNPAFGSIYPNNKTAGPGQCVYEQLGQANAVGIHLMAVPTTDKYFFGELPYVNHPHVRDYSTGAIQDISDITQWAAVWSNDTLFCSGHSHTADGDLFMAGGHTWKAVGPNKNVTVLNYTAGIEHVRLLKFNNDFQASTSMAAKNNKTNTFQIQTEMAYYRWYPSTMMLPDGRIAIIGGVSAAGNNGKGVKRVEIWDPKKPTLAPMPGYDMEEAHFQSFEAKTFYPFQWVLPTGHVFMYGDNVSRIVNPYTGVYIKNQDGSLVTTRPRPGGLSSTYPFTGSAVMAALTTDANNMVNSADFIIFGGGDRAAHPNHTKNWVEGFNSFAPAARKSHRISLSWTRQGGNGPWQYTFSDWQEDDMGYPRLMPDATMLPNGDIVVLNGAQTGVAGYATKLGALHNFPNFWAALYQPDLPESNRMTMLCGTTRPRMYHANAGLTTEGKVLIVGADRDENITDAKVPWFHGSGGVDPNYFMELFHPPYVYDTANQPMIMSVNGSNDPLEIGYNVPMTIQWGPGPNATADVNMTSVVMVMPSSTTHSFNFNQRVIQLRITRVTSTEIEVLTPLNPFTAVPSWYMLFINNVKTYSTAKWVKLVDYTGEGATIRD